ncbi:MAG: histidine triad nucleotide-binding protein [Chloroflexota bacterium]
MTEEQAKCVFCRIVSGSLPGDIVYQDDDVVAFRDIHPMAPTHIIIVPRTHIPSLNNASDQQGALLGKMMLVGKKLAEQENIASRGYRLVVNCGTEGGQVVPHLHMHLVGGRRLDDELG